MSDYIGTPGSRISVEATFKRTGEYQTHYTFTGEWHNIHVFEDADGNCIVWNTTAFVEDKKFVDQHGSCKPIWHGSKVQITATIKAHSEYKGVKQTTISRPRFKLVALAKSPDEIQKEREAEEDRKKQEQRDSLQEGDFIWEMPYKQYKERYSDCETIIGSYDAHQDPYGNSTGSATIKVIIREGRLKNSGVRGQHYSGYEFEMEDGTKVVYRAISEATARKRMKKEYPDSAAWACTRVYRYHGSRVW